MDWGDAPGWAALVVALLAVEISRRARKDGHRSARAAERSASAAEQTLADQRQQAADGDFGNQVSTEISVSVVWADRSDPVLLPVS
ncbi:hypothetical protein [Streptomyces flavofungini]|uniref:hypothetical protein n=1 Tax=Streptomyces flavofungini TaxID=68200 RepID=UPI0034DEB8BF